MKNNTLLQARLRRAGRRLWLIGSAGALVWGLAAAVFLLVFAAWLDLLWELSPSARIALVWGAAAAAAILLLVLAWRTACTARPAALARRLDTAVNSSGEILTGWELDNRVWSTGTVAQRWSAQTHQEKPQGGGSSLRLTTPYMSQPLTAGLVTMAAEHAETLARRAPLAKAVPAKPLGQALAVLAGQATVIGLLALVMPDLVKTEWNRFTQPMADVPPYSPLRFTVTPGNTRVLYGEELEIGATVAHGVADHLELVLQSSDGSQSSLPMFAESNGTWRAVLSKLTEPTVYFVRCYRARSEKYAIEIVTVPRIETVRVQIMPPQYADQPSYEGPVPDEGVKGLRGTKVTLWATSNRPLSGGKLLVSRALAVPPGHQVPMVGGMPPKGGTTNASGPARKSDELAMQPTEPGGQEAVGQFEITGDGKFEFQVIDDAGQPSQQSFSGNVTLVKDQYPLVRILKPPPQSLATPTALLPIMLSAEDDCGISRLELYRSLNHSRPLPAAVRLPPKAPHRRDEQFPLPLAGYGLEPGDVLTFFARVEDNDPAGAKGAESPVISVKIISQEEFEHMLRVRQGVEALASKFRQAQRRLEGLTKEVEGLHKKLQKAPADSRLAEETRKELRRLQRLMRREAASLRQSAAHRLPFDIDDKLSPEIGAAAEMTEKMAEELDKLEKQLDLSNKDLEQKLAKLLAQLNAGRRAYAASTMEPMELLEAVFPLIIDQQRFIVLAMRQEDLAQRMATLKGHDGDDDPALKTRMRDLEHEQRQIRLELDNLLGDIEDHATRLPERPEFKKLRETALKFVKDVRGSGATEALAGSEAALADFAGTRAYEKAKEAAEILNRFVKRCQGEGDMAGECHGVLVFQPKLCQCLGNSVAQLLAEMGITSGAGGMGTMGLYGNTAGMSGFGSGEFGDPSSGSQGRGEEQGANAASGGNPDVFGPGETAAEGTATSAGEAGVPLRYRRAVRQYFQRLSEELGDRMPAREAGPGHKK
jgi:hypothetical protein